MARASGVITWLLILCGAAVLVAGIINDIDGESVITGTALLLLAILIKGFQRQSIFGVDDKLSRLQAPTAIESEGGLAAAANRALASQRSKDLARWRSEPSEKSAS